ncbi:MAG: hypothetical protein FWF23_00270 [Alphaproteobacteria bacterium]|nr:hypothetical protein [Alphaproteobacteria bacterium]MCL2504966.1 hypothetical protein [Alphaproteobacteria bacterium]
MNSFSIKQAENGFSILRNDAVIKTPAGKELIVPSHGLAEMITEELSENCKTIKTAQDYKNALVKMPMMRLAMAAIDVVSERKNEIIDEIVSKIDTDIVCYRTGTNHELQKLENENWNPVVEWFSKKFETKLIIKDSIFFIEQSEAVKEKLKQYLLNIEPFLLSGISQAVSDTDSLLISLMLLEGELTPEKALELSALEELWQAKHWGEDLELRKKHRELMKDLVICDKWFGNVKS